MLKELYVKNIAVIDEIRLNFQTGFNVLTGETGAGKSILIGAIGLILGKKAKPGLARDGAKEACVEGIYDISYSPKIKQILEDNDLINEDDSNELVIRRVLIGAGKNKIYVNFKRSSLGILQQLGTFLVDYTGQHTPNELRDGVHDREILDSFLENIDCLKKYQVQFEKTKELYKSLENLKKKIQEKQDKLNWIDFQLSELNKLDVESEEEEQELLNQRNQMKHKEVLDDFAYSADQILSTGTNSCVVQFQVLRDKILKNEALKQNYSELLTVIDELISQTEDLSYEISKKHASIQVEGNTSLDQIESQLYNIEQFKRKFGPTLQDVLIKKAELISEKELLDRADEEIEKMEIIFSQEFEKLKALSLSLTAERKKTAKKVESLVVKELKDLMMPEARFVVKVELDKNQDHFSKFTKWGSEEISFWLSPNPGLDLKLLKDTASGGETSRIYLALKNVLSRHKPAQTLIFDEIDTGISGAVVELVGKKLVDLSKRFQVFCITHHAQIAALADNHFFVKKQVEKKQTFTRIQILKDEEQIQEVARLMGGVEISKKNLDFAREMVKLKS